MTRKTLYAECEDGKVRAFTFTGEPDTVWTRPARVSVNGRTVSGFVTCDTWNEPDTDPRTYGDDDPVDGKHYRFVSYKWRKNAGLITPLPFRQEVP